MYPILFKVFGFPIHSYGVMIVVAFVVGAWLARRRAASHGLEPAKLVDGLLGALIVGIIGARLFFILQDLPYYSRHPHELWSVQVAGVTSFGGILFGLIYLFAWAKKKSVPVWSVFDTIAPPFLIASAIGRVGCLLNGCCYGIACTDNLPWKIHVPDAAGWHHPAQIYDSLMCLLAYGLVVLAEKRNTAPGQSFSLAMMGFGLSRFIYEFWRAGTDQQVASGAASSTYWIGWLTQAQAVAGAMVLLGVVIYVVQRARYASHVRSSSASAS